jgi:hypothetical protein
LTMISNGTSIGHKRIEIFDPVTVIQVMVNTSFVDTPAWKTVSVHLCDQLVANTTSWEFTPWGKGCWGECGETKDFMMTLMNCSGVPDWLDIRSRSRDGFFYIIFT